MFSNLQSHSQNSPENLVSITEMISVGNPCSFHTSPKNTFATSFAVAFCSSAMKWAIFVNRSTTTIIGVLPCDSGSWVMK